jgi:hypothetical protein
MDVSKLHGNMGSLVHLGCGIVVAVVALHQIPRPTDEISQVTGNGNEADEQFGMGIR